MTTLKVSVDLAHLTAISGAVEAAVFQNLSSAVDKVAAVGAQRWREAAFRAKLWRTEAQMYADSISYRMTGPYSATISATYRYVEDIETGRPARDLKVLLNTSNKVRRNKKGQLYLIIPMRHANPASTGGEFGRPMPKHIYEEAKSLAPSRVTGMGKRLSARGVMVPQRKYQWGGRLPEGLAPKMKPHHATDIYSNMYRFNAESGKSGRYSNYLTFRIMGEWQTDKWIVAPKPGLYIAKGIADGLQSDAPRIFERALQADLAAA